MNDSDIWRGPVGGNLPYVRHFSTVYTDSAWKDIVEGNANLDSMDKVKTISVW